jgi:hypothetical protein
MNVLYVAGFLGVFVSLATITLSDTWPWWRWVTLGINAFSIWLLCRTLPKTRKLYRQWCAKRDELHRRLEHAVDRGDVRDVQLTLDLMAIWNVKPRVLPPPVVRGE